MSRVEVRGFHEVDRLFKELALEAEDVAIQAVTKAAPIVEDSIKRTLEQVTDRGYATGELTQSVRASEAKTNQWGVFSVVGPTGENKRGISNAEIAAYLEYGVHQGERQKHHKRKTTAYKQEPRPWRQLSAMRAETAVIDEVQQVITDMTEELL